MINLGEANEIITKFSVLPERVRNPTYLDICNFPGRRFEEICSKILAFYLLPNNEHGLKDLFIRSLLEIIDPKNDSNNSSNQIKISLEEYADGKRIDIIILADNFIIGIENKIFAELYNPLDCYRNRIDEYDKDNAFKIVLSLRKISKSSEIELLEKNGFDNILYSDWFKSIRKNIELYQNDSSEKYLFILNDFMDTIENKRDNSNIDSELNKFFYDNYRNLENLTAEFNKFQNSIIKEQSYNLSPLLERIKAVTKDVWWLYQGWDLGCELSEMDNYKIGIESNYIITKYTPIGQFIIHITTWSKKDWNHFKRKLLEIFPDRKLVENDNKTMMIYEILDEFDDDLIIEHLETLFNKLNNQLIQR